MNEGFWSLLKTVFNWLKQQGPALGLLIYDYKDAQVKAAEQEKQKAELALKVKENHDKVDSDNAGVSDTDGVNKIAGPRE